MRTVNLDVPDPLDFDFNETAFASSCTVFRVLLSIGGRAKLGQRISSVLSNDGPSSGYLVVPIGG